MSIRGFPIGLSGFSSEDPKRPCMTVSYPEIVPMDSRALRKKKKHSNGGLLTSMRGWVRCYDAAPIKVSPFNKTL
jgi:hypothetical protein